MDELRLALRRLTKRPASTLASIATLAGAVAAAAVTWSALSAVLIHPLRVPDADRLFVVGYQTQGATGSRLYTGLLYPAYHQVRESGAFEQTVAQWSGTHLLLVSVGDMPVRTDVGFVTHDYFDVVGVPIVLGREFDTEDDRRGAEPAAVLTHRYWRGTFNADPTVIGRTILVAGKRVTIVGVLEQGFRGLDLAEKPDLYLPFHTIADVGGRLTNYFAEPGHQSSPTSGTMIFGRLRSRTALAEAVSRIAALKRGDGRPTVSNPVIIRAATAAIPAAARPGMERFSTILAVTVALLLVIGCSSVGMLLLIRTDARRAEFAMCMALGASRARLARGIAGEGAILAVAGSCLALPMSWWLFGLIQGFQLPGDISIELLELSLDVRVLAACVAASVLALLLIALVAGVFGFRADVSDALRARSGVTPKLSGRTTRAALVGAQVAVAVTLLAGAGLFARSLIGALTLNRGLDMSRTVIGTVHLGQYGFSPQRATEFFETLRARLETQPAIRSVALTRWEGGMGPGGRIKVDGLDRQFPTLVSYIRVDPQFFRTMGIRIVQGRDFSSEDRAGGPAVTVVSASLARLLANGGEPLGRRLEGFSAADRPLQVVGVASDVITNVTVMEPLIIYLPHAQRPPEISVDLVVQSAGDVADTRREILAAVRALDPQVTPTPLRTLEERIAAQMGPQQLGMTVLGALGTLAVFLTLLGTYVLADSMATLRMREMGIRAALGATRRQLGSIVITETARLIGIGLGAGLLLAWLGSNTIRAFLFQVQPLDPVTLGSVAGLILALALAVSLRAAVRVARVDLASVLKAE